MSEPVTTYKCNQCGSWIDAQTGQCAAEAKIREQAATIERLTQELAISEMTTAVVKDQRDALEQERNILNAECIAVGNSDRHYREALATARETVERLTTWQPMGTAPHEGIPILVNFGRCGVHLVSWEESVMGTIGWCVDDRKHGPYALRGYLDSDVKGWMYAPDAALAQPAAKEEK